MTPCWRWSAAVLGGSACALAGCCPTLPAPSAPAPAEAGPAPLAEAPPSAPVFSNCVLHAGDLETTERREHSAEGQPGPVIIEGTCSFNAECVAQRGVETPGDGSVELECAAGECSCRLEPLAPPGAAVVFRFRAPCTSAEESRRLMLERCMKGMQLAAGAADG